jgi:hypothetical protein
MYATVTLTPAQDAYALVYRAQILLHANAQNTQPSQNPSWHNNGVSNNSEQLCARSGTSSRWRLQRINPTWQRSLPRDPGQTL